MSIDELQARLAELDRRIVELGDENLGHQLLSARDELALTLWRMKNGGGRANRRVEGHEPQTVRA